MTMIKKTLATIIFEETVSINTHCCPEFSFPDLYIPNAVNSPMKLKKNAGI